jgi:hypothetical protein
MSRRLKVGDHVREVDGEAVGIIVHIMRYADLVVVNWLPSQQGIAFHPSDLVKMASLDKRVDNPDYENSHHNEYPIGNLNARYRCFLAEPFAEPFHGFSAPHLAASHASNAFTISPISQSRSVTLAAIARPQEAVVTQAGSSVGVARPFLTLMS